MSAVNQKDMLPCCASDTIPAVVYAAIQRQLHTNPQNKESFFIGDESYIHNQLKRWQSCFNNVRPFYGELFFRTNLEAHRPYPLTEAKAVKSNDNPMILKILAEHGVGFDCASKSEIKRILDLGVEPRQILYAAPIKSEDHILYARERGVIQTMFDSEDELRKLAIHFPTAELYLRLWADDPTSRVRLGEKFGVQLPQAKELLALAKDVNMKVVGLCFHVGSNASDCDAYRRAIALSREVYDYNENFGEEKKHPIHTIDIGGGFSSGNFGTATRVVNESIQEYFGTEKQLRWAAEPGRFFSDEAFHLACRVIGTRPRNHSGDEISLETELPAGDIYINDGIYHNFLNAITEKVVSQPILLDSAGRPDESVSEDQSTYTVWGQTCDSFDKISPNCALPRRAKVGDWLCFPAMGAYTHVTASDFNGFSACKRTIWISNSTDEPWHILSVPFRTLKALHSYILRAFNFPGAASRDAGGIHSSVNRELAVYKSSTGLAGKFFAGIKSISHLSRGAPLTDRPGDNKGSGGLGT
ncbi:Ornithine decarboxylase [Emydomyces testavorans]|uniref:Ornithine decarboxylase n=1 Tax=Emydomyces testavorans TaxID=2070801 RepID=A0AAF0DMW0_9EURO|nr:Ornithine decarboxylase [Emydomyces testavorans]